MVMLIPVQPRFFCGVRVTRSLVLCVSFVDRCLSFCTFSFWPLCCLFFFDTRILIILVVSSNSSYFISGQNFFSVPIFDCILSNSRSTYWVFFHPFPKSTTTIHLCSWYSRDMHHQFKYLCKKTVNNVNIIRVSNAVNFVAMAFLDLFLGINNEISIWLEEASINFRTQLKQVEAKTRMVWGNLVSFHGDIVGLL